MDDLNEAAPQPVSNWSFDALTMPAVSDYEVNNLSRLILEWNLLSRYEKMFLNLYRKRGAAMRRVLQVVLILLIAAAAILAVTARTPAVAAALVIGALAMGALLLYLWITPRKPPKE
jgi:heme A synthase